MNNLVIQKGVSIPQAVGVVATAHVKMLSKTEYIEVSIPQAVGVVA